MGSEETARSLPRQFFAEQLSLLLVEAGQPLLDTVAAEATKAGAPGVTGKRLSAWRRGENLPRWEQLHPLLIVLLKRARKEKPQNTERYKYEWWQARLEEARRRPATAAERSGSARAADTWAAQPSAPPYRGLESFRPRDAEIFFGRQNVTEKLVGQLAATGDTGGITMLVAASGAGKSSLVQAGLLPALAKDALPGCATWPVVLLSPGEDPPATLVREVPDLMEALAPAGSRHLVVSRNQHPDQLAERVRVAIRAYAEREAGPGARLVLIVDQAEEMFTLCDDECRRRLFIDTLQAACTPPPGAVAPALVVFAVRADFTESCLQHEPLAAAYEDRLVVLGRMSGEELRAAITMPARRAGLSVDPDLVDHLLREVGGRGAARAAGRARGRRADPGLLPLLSHALLATWQQRKTGKLTLADYWRGGGIDQAIARTADRTWAQLDAVEQTAAMGLLLRMVRVGHDTPATRRRCDKRRLIEQAPNRCAAAKALDVLATARLVTLDAESAQITHEALLANWPLLSDRLAEDRQGNLIRQDLDEAAAEWVSDHDPGLLYRGSRLAVAHGWATRHHDQLSPAAADFLTASDRYARRSRKIRRAGVAALATALVLALSATTLAIVQGSSARRERGTAIVNQVIAQADRLRGTNVSLAAQLDLTAYRMHPTPRLSTDLLTTENSALSTALGGHTSIVRSLAYSPDGRTLASCDDDGTVRLWNVADPTHPTALGATPAQQQRSVRSVAFTADGHVLAAAGTDGTIRLWNLADPAHPTPLGTPLRAAAEAVRAVAFSPTGNLLASGEADGTVRLWNLADPTHPAALGAPFPSNDGEVRSVAFSHDGHILATAGMDGAGGNARLWNVTDAAHPAPLGPPLTQPDLVDTVAFSPDGHLLATGGAGQTVQLWNTTDPAHPAPLGAPLAGHANSVFCVSFSPDGHTLASASADDTLRLWNVSDPAHATLLGAPLSGHDGGVDAVAFSPDGHTLASGSADHTVRLWNIPPILTGSTASIDAVAFSPDGHTLASGGAPRTVRLWDVSDSTAPTPLGPPLPGPLGSVDAVAFSPDGRTLAAAGVDHTVRLWNVADPAHPRALGTALAGHTATVYQVAFSPDGRTVASASADETVRLWNIAPVLAGQTVVDPVAFSPDGHPLASLTKDRRGGVGAIAFSPDGHTLACGDQDYTVRLWNVTDAAHPAPLAPPLTGHTSYVSALTYSPDGRTLASGSADHTVQLWNVTDPAHPAPQGPRLREHSNSVTSVDYSPDGRTLASGSDDHTVRLWNVADPAHPTPWGHPLTGHAGPVRWVAFSPDGHNLASASRDASVLIWPTRVDQAIHRICSTTAGTLTANRWSQFVSADMPYQPPCP